MAPLSPSLKEFLPDGSRFELDPHQVDGVKWMIRHRHFLQGDEMRLGKTIQALVVFAIIHDQGFGNDFLVVCPNGLKPNWRDEILEKTEFPVVVINGTPTQRAKQWEAFNALTGPRIMVMNYEQIQKNLDQINAVGFDIAVYDECHMIKNPESKRTQATLLVKAKQYFPMTGSPLLNQVNELWTHLHRIDPEGWPNYWSFVHRYCVFGGHKGKQVVGCKNEAELTDALAKIMIRRKRRDVYPGLEKVPTAIVYLDMHPEQQKLYNQIRDELLMSIPGVLTPLVIESSLTKMLRLKQVCGTTAAIDGWQDISPKLDRAVAHAREFMDNGKHVVFWTQFRSTLGCLSQRLQAEGMPVYELHGGVPAMKRNDVKNAWRDDTPCPLVAMIQIGGVGMDMTASSDAVFLDKVWTPAINEQAEDRITGRSQTDVAMIHCYAMRHSIEQYIEMVLNRKDKLFQQIVETGSWKRQLLEMLANNP